MMTRRHPPGLWGFAGAENVGAESNDHRFSELASRRDFG
jgi:hypothetical protein